MLNHIVLQGRLGSDPEIKVTPNGVEVCTVSIAVDRDIKNQNNERETDWISVTAWRGTAKFLADYFRKGSMCIVSGRLQTRNYTDNDGNKHYVTEVIANNIYFGGSKNETAQTAPAHPSYAAPAADFEELSPDDQLPF